jgi:hypothetical protein
MREDSKNRYCQKCGADMLGNPIPEESLDSYGHKRDDGTWSNTHFSRWIAIYCLESDRTVGTKCPDCDAYYERVFGA